MDAMTDLSKVIYGLTTQAELNEIINYRYFGERVFIDPPTSAQEMFNLILLANDLFTSGEENRSGKSCFDDLDSADYTFKGPYCHVMNYLSRKIEFIKNGADPADYSEDDLENFCNDTNDYTRLHFGNFTIGRRL